jgi:hypothetical protein
MRKIEASDEEKLKSWFDVKRQNGMVDFKVDVSKQALANTFGGRLVWDSSGGQQIEWPEGTDLDAINRHIQREMHRFIETANDPTKSRLIKNDKDDFGNMLDEAHPDYKEESARLEHVNLMRKSFPNGEMISSYELEFVARGLVAPLRGPRYKDMFARKLSEMKERRAGLKSRYEEITQSIQLVDHTKERQELLVRLGKIDAALENIERLS